MSRANVETYGFLVAVLLGAALIVGIGVFGAVGSQEISPECASMARAVASRTHSILDSARYRATEKQAYEVCLTDPPAFRRIARGY